MEKVYVYGSGKYKHKHSLFREREKEKAFHRKAKSISTHGREPNDILTNRVDRHGRQREKEIKERERKIEIGRWDFSPFGESDIKLETQSKGASLLSLSLSHARLTVHAPLSQIIVLLIATCRLQIMSFRLTNKYYNNNNNNCVILYYDSLQ